MQRLEVCGAVRPLYGSLGGQRVNMPSPVTQNLILIPPSILSDVPVEKKQPPPSVFEKYRMSHSLQNPAFL